ncbi:MAG: carbohydrate kinase [Thermoplasmatales archaeon]|nr:carbohydrate kinase [Thermoplasmatales archaeon]
MRPFLSVYGHVSIDKIISVRDFPRLNTSINILSKKNNMGGTASNIAYVAATLGVPTMLCAFIGDDFPQEYRERLKDAGVMTDGMIETEYGTSEALVINDRNFDQKVLFYQGPQGWASRIGIDLSEYAEGSEYVHFSTGEPDYYISQMEKLKNTPYIVFDPAQEIHEIWNKEKFNRALALSDIFFCNEHESVSAEKYIGGALDTIKKHLVVRTDGSKGSRAFIDGRRVDVPAVKPDRVMDTTGAGDAFRAGFYAAKYRKHDTEQALIIAAATSSFVVEAYGAVENVPTWDMVMERADDYLRRI